MSQINQEELQNLRHFIGAHKTLEAKLSQYANTCQDPQVRQIFQQASNSARNSAQKLMSFL